MGCHISQCNRRAQTGGLSAYLACNPDQWCFAGIRSALFPMSVLQAKSSVEMRIMIQVRLMQHRMTATLPCRVGPPRSLLYSPAPALWLYDYAKAVPFVPV